MCEIKKKQESIEKKDSTKQKVFFQLDQLNHAEFWMKNMKGRKYDGREIKWALMN